MKIGDYVTSKRMSDKNREIYEPGKIFNLFSSDTKCIVKWKEGTIVNYAVNELMLFDTSPSSLLSDIDNLISKL